MSSFKQRTSGSEKSLICSYCSQRTEIRGPLVNQHITSSAPRHRRKDNHWGPACSPSLIWETSSLQLSLALFVNGRIWSNTVHECSTIRPSQTIQRTSVQDSLWHCFDNWYSACHCEPWQRQHTIIVKKLHWIFLILSIFWFKMLYLF